MKKRLKLSGSTGGLLAFLLGLLGFTFGCKARMEYGAPHADYQIRGTVHLSTDNAPVAGATVKVLFKYDGKYADNNYFKSVTTDVQGDFSMDPVGSGASLQGMTALEFSKAGAIKTDTVDVTSWQKVSDGKGWYSGAFVGTVDAKVKPEQQ